MRSRATRGRLGGLAPATAGTVSVLAAYGCDVIFVETVGAGQAEVDIAGAADTVVLVTVPVLGDAVQTLKAGIMEIADIFVVNKADCLLDDGTLIRRRQARHRREIIEIVQDRLLARAGNDRLDQLALSVARGELDPYSAADTLITGGNGHDEPAHPHRHRGPEAGGR